MKSSSLTAIMRRAAAAALIATASPNALALPPEAVRADLTARTAATGHTSPVQWLDTASISPDERRAMEFLYAYMPLADEGNHSPQFYLDNVRSSLQARREMPWGASVPEREFMHFVLPVRVNNEDLDMSRPAFYNELRDRVKGLSMADAILEVNHWCHEKATYAPSDGRTSSPLSTVSQAIGRCGEESTFAVAALRAVGIPARQVYTPRWAHTDDNHAWVEAWADGRWHFIGACEPEPMLDLAWFNAPASRGMLMNTKVFGHYDGPEEVLERTPTNTIINVTANYAPVRTAAVRVTDREGRPAAGATVSFCIYNYAEFYPTAVKSADSLGRASLRCGLGDLVVWATDGTDFGVAKSSPADTLTELRLNRTPGWTGSFDLDIVPPPTGATIPTPTPAQAAACALRLAAEDSIRSAYTSTFATAADAAVTARLTGLDSATTARVLTQARGNHRTLSRFLEQARPCERQKALSLLLSISEKDRRDITAEVLDDHLATAPAAAGIDSATYADYVVNPRIDTEGLTPYKSFFAEAFSPAERARFAADPSAWTAWCADSIAADTDWNRLAIRMSPASVWRLRRADSRSRSIFYVAGARSFGIPARIDQVTGKTQWRAAGSDSWTDVAFGSPETASSAPSSPLTIEFTPSQRIDDPRYYSQFSLSRIADGRPQLLEFGEDDTAGSISVSPTRLDTGRYLMVSGQRLADGSVLARAEVFDVAADRPAKPVLTIRQDSTALQVIGSFNSENRYQPLDGGAVRSLLSTTGRGYYVIGFIRPNHEPSVHCLNDMAGAAAELEKTGRKLILLFADKPEASRFSAEAFAALPSNVVFGIDPDGALQAELTSSLRLDASERPLVAVADTFNRVVFATQGYTIGIGHTLADVLNSLSE